MLIYRCSQFLNFRIESLNFLSKNFLSMSWGVYVLGPGMFRAGPKAMARPCTIRVMFFRAGSCHSVPCRSFPGRSFPGSCFSGPCRAINMRVHGSMLCHGVPDIALLKPWQMKCCGDSSLLSHVPRDSRNMWEQIP